MQASEEAISEISKNEISELKSFSKPVEAVKHVMSALLLLLDADSIEWACARKVMSSPDFKNTLLSFNKDNIPEHILNRVDIYTQSDFFQPNNIVKYSLAAA
jgi:dynein heavy chain